MNAALIFFPDTVKSNRITVKIPLYLRICFRRTKTESRLNIKVSENESLIWDSFTMRLIERNNPVNHYLNHIQQKFQEFLILNTTELLQHTASTIRDIIFGRNQKNKIIIMQFVDKYFEESVMNNSNRAEGTIKNYRRAINHMNAYLNHLKKQNRLLDELNVEFASGFKNFLFNTNPAIKRLGMCEVSAETGIK